MCVQGGRQMQRDRQAREGGRSRRRTKEEEVLLAAAVTPVWRSGANAKVLDVRAQLTVTLRSSLDQANTSQPRHREIPSIAHIVHRLPAWHRQIG